jgi:hypothetical protein
MRSIMFTVVDMLYREYCHARLAEMRRQLFVPAAGAKTIPPPQQDDDPPDQGSSRTTKEPPSIG